VNGQYLPDSKDIRKHIPVTFQINAHYVHLFKQAEDPLTVDPETLIDAIEFTNLALDFQSVPNTENCFILHPTIDGSVAFCTEESYVSELQKAIKTLALCRSNGFQFPRPGEKPDYDKD
jgi:hypothetical protein